MSLFFLSQFPSTAPPSPERYDNRYEKKVLKGVSAVAGTLGSILFPAASDLDWHSALAAERYRLRNTLSLAVLEPVAGVLNELVNG